MAETVNKQYATFMPRDRLSPNLTGANVLIHLHRGVSCVSKSWLVMALVLEEKKKVL